ncbi:hypothetical protein L1987_59165 [Smallanthus sonchifolius]|uniref:Uncharacterized protein n=1 Tax=Smallanthus sonchifolius TaxID=185202 RepID=A0ACB9D551_9ASTR|nr:hypothetical protein L1987_59165 [Smallanthus sonchifolius]
MTRVHGKASIAPTPGSLSSMGLVGQLVGDIGGLTELTSLDLSFNGGLTGPISPRIGDLKNLDTLILMGCSFTGSIPPELGNLNELSFLHFNKNKLSGVIPSQIFNEDMVLIHVLFDGNQFNGGIPNSIGSVETLEVLRLDRNALEGEVPSTLNKLTSLGEFIMEFGSLKGKLPEALFGLSGIQQVSLKNNNLNDTLDMGGNISDDLQVVDLQNNKIDNVTLSTEYKNKLELFGNPVCNKTLEQSAYCQLQQSTSSYSTSFPDCGSKPCPSDQKPSPLRCDCAYPYEGNMFFRAPSFSVLSNDTLWRLLESSLWTKLSLTPGSVALQNPFFNINDYLQVNVQFFPSKSKHFTRLEVQKMGFYLSNQTYKPPAEFGPYYFLADMYLFADGHGGVIGVGAVIGMSIGCTLLILVLIALMLYAVQQKRHAEKAISISKTFASWAPSTKDNGGAPQLKGARWFSYDELKKFTSNFSENNLIGSGGYGKVNLKFFSIGRGDFVWLLGYLDPEYYMTQQLTDKSDVYSFGVVMLELITAKQPIVKGKYIVREVRLAMDKTDEEEYGLRELLDPNLKDSGFLTGFGRFIQLAMQCVEESAADRPTMSDIVKVLENILKSDGIHTSSSSASSSATEFGSSRDARKHIYNEEGSKG